MIKNFLGDTEYIFFASIVTGSAIPEYFPLHLKKSVATQPVKKKGLKRTNQSSNDLTIQQSIYAHFSGQFFVKSS